jgi:integrase
LEHQAQTAKVFCPECKSEKYFRDGKRKLANGETAQRYVCRVCDYRYTYPTNLNAISANSDSIRICTDVVKNLEPVQRHKFCAGDAIKVDANTKGLLTQFYAYMEREAYSVESDYVDKVKHLAIRGANLLEPESVKTIIGQMHRKDGKPTKNGTKMLYCYAYDAFVKMLKLHWDMPTYTQEDHDPFVPDETELDALISAAKSKLLAAFLQSLKETFGDPGEVLRIKWLDVDVNNKKISIRYPVKNHLPRTLQVSNRLLSMIDALPKTDDRVFPTPYGNMLRRFVTMRKRTADIHKNPRLLAVDFTAFRTWAGTMIAYHTNGNVLTVKKLLGHKQIKNTMKYIGRIEFQSQDFETTSAATVEDILRLGKEGWIEYSVIKISNVEYHCFKKPKRFSSYV